MRRKNFPTSCLSENSSVLFAIGIKFGPLLRTNFSELLSGRYLWNCNYGVLAIKCCMSATLGPIKCSSFRVLLWCKWLKIVALGSSILALIELNRTTGQTLES